MRVNTNSTSYYYPVLQLRINGIQGKPVQKLSSGLQNNRVGNDAAGLAITGDMRDQNSVLQTASGNRQDSKAAQLLSDFYARREANNAEFFGPRSTVAGLEAAESDIRDADMAQEMMYFTRQQIITQAGTAILAQANQNPQNVLQLIGIK